jgi:hypothetical protein
MLNKSHVLNVFNEIIDKYANMQKLYDIFLSHKQSEAQDRAKVYKCYLEKNNMKVFYDRDELSDNDWTPEKVIELVARSKSLIFFITPNILNASWCHWELYIAIRSKIKIIILYVDPWPNNKINIKDLYIPDYLHDAFNNKNIIYDDRYKFDKCIKNIIKILKTTKLKTIKSKTIKLKTIKSKTNKSKTNQ